MSEVEVQPTASPATKTKKGNEKKVAKHAKPTHPPTSDMVNNAIKGLKERSGSSLQAIKKYIATNYKVDPVKLAPFIKKYLNSAVQSGSLVQTKGKGASGSFKLAASGAPGQGKTKTVKPKKVVVVGGGEKKKKSVVAKTQSTEKAKSASAAAKSKKPTGEKKPKVAKSPSKVKKTAKSPLKKPKAPKPKTVKAVAASSKAKKPASPKKKK